jgi:hypothetical protein
MTDRDDADKPEVTGGDEPTEAFAAQPEQAPGDEPRRGSVRFQDPGTTKPREPTLAEQRARRRALQRESEEAVAEREAAEGKSRTRRKIFIGGGVAVGVVAMVATWYAAATPDEVSATCVGPGDQVAPGANSGDDNCDENYVRSHGGYYDNYSHTYFIPFGGGYTQYHYYYGGSVGPGGHVSGGSYTAPSSNTKVTSKSGKTVQRGGFGVSGGGKSGGS